jgi:3-phosphoshikimate 1-carboxyvinyltransferase
MLLIPPLSKSDAQRALVLADILGVSFEHLLPAGEALPRDVDVLRAGLDALRAPTARIDCHDGGAPFRFLLTQAAVLPSKIIEFTGTTRLGERPHAPLVAALRASLGPKGLRLTEGNPWPVRVESPGMLRGPFEFTVTGTLSSQFASSLLLGAARLAVATGEVITLTLEGEFTSRGYFALTQSWLERTGFSVAARDGSLWVSAPVRRSEFPRIPGDWSSIGYLLALSWVSGVPVDRVATGTGHPDEVVGELLRKAFAPEGTPFEQIDAETCPDSIPTLAVVATKLRAPSTFLNTGILRHKESDRLAGLQRLLGAAGVPHSLEGETLTVQPHVVQEDFRFDALDDHRMAMSASVLARLHSRKLTLRGMASVAKSFPNFWLEAAKADVSVESWT